MKEVLILTAGFGEGHNAAARGLKKALDARPEAGCHAEIIDLIDEGYGLVGHLCKKTYAKVISHMPWLWAFVYRTLDRHEKLRHWLINSRQMRVFMDRLLRERQPAAIVSVYPAYGHSLHFLRQQKPGAGYLHVPFIKIVTDSLTVNRVWISGADEWVVSPNPPTSQILRDLGTPPERILDFGFPVNPAYTDQSVQREPLAPGAPLKVFFMINSDAKSCVRLAEALARRQDVQLSVAVGRRPKLEALLAERTKDSPNPVEILGWIDDLPARIRRSHVLIGKAGGATTQECIAAGCPMIINEVCPGQEEGNAQLIRELGAGAVAKGEKEILSLIGRLRENEGALWQNWAEALKEHAPQGAAVRLAEFVARTIELEKPRLEASSNGQHGPPLRKKARRKRRRLLSFTTKSSR